MSGDDDDKRRWWHQMPRGDRSSSANLRIMIIAIISLSSVILLFLALHIYARFVLRRRLNRRRANALRRLALSQHSRSLPQSAAVPKPGLSPAVVAALPTFKFKNLSPTGEYRSDDVAMECSVCLSLLEEEELVRQLPNCKHVFHVACVDRWLEFNSSCPLCRAEAEPAAVEPSAPPADIEHGEPPVAVAKGGPGSAASTSRMSSFRRMLSGDRSSMRQVQPPAPPEVELGA
uniref:RING-type E3 ubiquitin transferase n=1 Tax=Kalanchoe fedtschenkoi TaxID=63787 RepID=A0A7N0VBD5_KALFE